MIGWALSIGFVMGLVTGIVVCLREVRKQTREMAEAERDDR